MKKERKKGLDNPFNPKNPFRPGSGIFPPHFAGRKREEDTFKKKLDSAINSNFIQHMAFIGGWGIGKTSLLLKFKEIAKDVNCQILPIQLYSMTDPRNFVELFVNSASFVIPPSNWDKFTKKVNSFGITIFGFGVELQKKEMYFEPQTMLQHILKTIWENSKKPKLIIVFIDDMQLISNTQKILEIMRNVFTWSSNENYKFMLVVSGTEDLFEKFQQAHAPLTRFFEPLIVQPLSAEEIKEAITRPLKDTKIRFSNDAIKEIINLSEGNPFYVQLLCSHAFEHATNNQVSIKEFKLAFVSAINDVSARMFNDIFNKTTEHEKKILQILLESEIPLLWGEIIKKSKKYHIKESSARTATKRLVDEGLIIKITKGKFEKHYILLDNMFKSYLEVKIKQFQ